MFDIRKVKLNEKRIYEPLALFAVAGVLFLLFSIRYTMTFEVQKGYSCLNATMLIVDTWDKDIKRNDLFAFKFPVDGNEIFPLHTKFLKIARGVPGDTINISPDYTTTMSHKIGIDMRPIGNKLKIDVDALERKVTLQDGEYFAMGETVYSFDSRFWGTIPKENIIGKAYVVF